MDALVKPLEDLFSKAPALPLGGREFLVKVAPWLALIFGVLSILGAVLGIMGASVLTAAMPYAAAEGLPTGGFTLAMWVSVALTLVYGVVLLVAFPGLRKRQLKGWNMLFLAEIISIASSVVSIVLTMSIGFSAMSIVWTIIWAVVFLYLLFQIKPHYK